MKNLTLVYTSPNGEYFIYSNEGSVWARIFGVSYNIYNSDYSYGKSIGNLKDCFSWLYKLKVISKDELEEELRKVG